VGFLSGRLVDGLLGIAFLISAGLRWLWGLFTDDPEKAARHRRIHSRTG
jgi:hypothetical protein